MVIPETLRSQRSRKLMRLNSHYMARRLFHAIIIQRNMVRNYGKRQRIIFYPARGNEKRENE